MEQLNKVELRGTVGTVHTQVVGALTHYCFSVATNYAYQGKDGGNVIETTWHMVRGFSDKMVGGPIKKGDKVSVTGRIRTDRYTDADGNDKTQYFILAQKIKKLSPWPMEAQSA